MILTQSFILFAALAGAGIFFFLAWRACSGRPWLKLGGMSLAVLMTVLTTWHVILSASAKQVYVNWSPDRTWRVVTYRLPMYWGPPGSSSDAPGFSRLYDAEGRCRAHVNLNMIQSGDVNWFPDCVEIGVKTLYFSAL
ncbi:MAG: hypothetical protein V4662_05035 [Verrucomicrobiota bacterium]